MREYDDSFISKLIQLEREYDICISLVDLKGKDYVVASDLEIPNDVKTEEIARKVSSNPHLFFVHEFAKEIIPGNEHLVLNNVLNYAKKNETIRVLYSEFKFPIPDRVTTQEVNALMRVNLNRYNPKYNATVQTVYGTALVNYFKEIKKKGLAKKWYDFNRSEKANLEAGLVESVRNFVKRSNEVDLKTLCRNSDKLETIEISEEAFQQFRQFMKEYHSDILYYPHDKDVIDWGTLKVPEHLKDVAENPFEGEQRYFESRRITFRESDAPVVYSALNGISFERLEESLKNLPTILNRGSYEIEKIPIDDIDNVCSLAKANNVNLYVDLHGNYSTPEAETLSVLFNSFDRHMMDAIMNRIFVEKSAFSHAVNTEQKKGIDSPDKIKQKKSLKELMDYAREKQGSYQQDRNVVEKDPLIR